MPEEALAVVKAWGFELKTMVGFCWHKTTKHGKSHFGMGHWTRANTEDCLFAVRGKPKRVNADVRQFIEAPRGRHSAKPDEVRERLVRLVGDVPRLEMFAREAIPGWDGMSGAMKWNPPSSWDQRGETYAKSRTIRACKSSAPARQGS